MGFIIPSIIINDIYVKLKINFLNVNLFEILIKVDL